jgi:hypothetical protein
MERILIYAPLFYFGLIKKIDFSKKLCYNRDIKERKENSIMGKNANDYLESLFIGIDTIIDKRFETLAYDKTIICTVVDHSNSKNGEYKVNADDVIYTAYSDTNRYSSGD